ncbi:alpha-N-acetylgalactosaminide alpha-2,6-sialyltransferase 3-like isoform X2 [Antedon mediterranea]|uniref:alpha-N-acetylgalactosaminide alpha-2,6-sialyltransferase 3-like isoform X2 n=1 Tax=Antedon mediterranea TaxID=105859 RepID=UPI003AF58861
MENKQILLYTLVCYGIFMICFCMFYTQQYVNSHAKVRSDYLNANATSLLLTKLYHIPAQEDTFLYVNKTLIKTREENEKTSANSSKVVKPTKPPEIISVRKYYISLADSKQTLDYNCSVCALVSSSGQLMGRGLGKEIDANQCVIRMNNAPSGIYHEDVGNRTTIRMGSFNAVKAYINQKYLFAGDVSPDVVITWGLYQKKHEGILKAAKTLPKLYPNTKFYAESLKGEDYAGIIFEKETGLSRQKTKTWLSTGWFTMLMAIDICDKVNLYGFIPEDHCQTHPGEIKKYHYYQSPNSSLAECKYYSWNEARKGTGHRFLTEKAVFARWGRRYNMTFHAPSWNITMDEKKIETPFMKNQNKAKLIKKRYPVKRRHL